MQTSVLVGRTQQRVSIKPKGLWSQTVRENEGVPAPGHSLLGPSLPLLPERRTGRRSHTSPVLPALWHPASDGHHSYSVVSFVLISDCQTSKPESDLSASARTENQTASTSASTTSLARLNSLDSVDLAILEALPGPEIAARRPVSLISTEKPDSTSSQRPAPPTIASKPYAFRQSRSTRSNRSSSGDAASLGRDSFYSAFPPEHSPSLASGQQSATPPSSSGGTDNFFQSASSSDSCDSSSGSSDRSGQKPVSTPKLREHKICGVDEVMRWYASVSSGSLRSPPPAALPEGPGDLFIHRCDDGTQAWIGNASKQWTKIAQGARHPRLPEHRLWISSKGKPTWIRRKTMSGYQGKGKQVELS